MHNLFKLCITNTFHFADKYVNPYINAQFRYPENLHDSSTKSKINPKFWFWCLGNSIPTVCKK